MSAIAYSLAVRNAKQQATINAIDGASTPGKMQFYTAPRPASGAALTTQTLLGTCTFSQPSATVANGLATFAALADEPSAPADGIASWVRIVDGAGTWVSDMDVTPDQVPDPAHPGQMMQGPGPVRMVSTQIYRGGIIRVTSMTIGGGNV